MYASAHSRPLPRKDLKLALRRLEKALARHERVLREAAGASGSSLEMMRATVAMLNEGVAHLRWLAQE